MRLELAAWQRWTSPRRIVALGCLHVKSRFRSRSETYSSWTLHISSRLSGMKEQFLPNLEQVDCLRAFPSAFIGMHFSSISWKHCFCSNNRVFEESVSRPTFTDACQWTVWPNSKTSQIWSYGGGIRYIFLWLVKTWCNIEGHRAL